MTANDVRAEESPAHKGLRLLGHHRIESRILILFLAVLGIGFGLVKLGSEVAHGDTFAIDKAILTGLRQAGDTALPIAPQWVTDAMIDITALGGVTVLTLVTLFAVGFLIASGKYRAGLFVGASVGAGALMAKGLKAIFTRARPEIVEHLVPVNSASFPSGHAMSSALVYLTLAMLVARTRPSRGVRVYLISCAIMLTLIIGCSRVYLGVHWPSDVIAGWGVGGMWAVLSTLAFKAAQEKRAV